MSTESRLRIDVWSDIACPWCYVGKRRLEGALAQFPQRDRVEVVWRAFELDPSAAPERDPAQPYAARLAKKYGRSLREAEGMIARMAETAHADGLTFDFSHAQHANTFDAHRLVHLGAVRGRQDEVKERLFRAYFTEGEAIGDRETLVRLGVEAGLNEEEVRTALSTGAYGDDVRADELQAAQLGIRGVPFFVLDGRLGVSGAQPSQALLQAIERAWNESTPRADDAADGAACGPDGCG